MSDVGSSYLTSDIQQLFVHVDQAVAGVPMQDTLYTLAQYRFKIELIAFLVLAAAVSCLIYWLGWHAPVERFCTELDYPFIQYTGGGGAFIPPAEWPAAWRWRITWLLLWRTLALALVVVGLLRRWSREALLFCCCVALFLVWFGRVSAITPQHVLCVISVDYN
jgi:hypothetical protein